YTKPTPRSLANRTTGAEGCFDSWSLAHVVEAAALKVDEHSLSPLRSPGAGATDARRMLILLAWCYARLLYSTVEIHRRLHSSPAMHIWNGAIPDEEEIRQFRDENQAAIQDCLKAALRFQAGQKMAEGFITRFNEVQIAEEATRRI